MRFSHRPHRRGGWPAAILLLSATLPFAVAQAKKEEQLKVRPGQVPSVEIIPAVPPEPLLPPGPPPDLEILFTSQVQGFYQPCG
jgi:hypothetical protein